MTVPSTPRPAPLLQLDASWLGAAAGGLPRPFADTGDNDEAGLAHLLGEIAETRSVEGRQHAWRVGECARLLGETIGLSRHECELLRSAAPMHDLGKIGIPDSILGKPGPLSLAEFEVVKTHTTIGHDILKGSGHESLQAAATIALQHHEHWDGSGYPHGLSRDGIHLFARIVGLVDAFDALAGERVHKKAWPIDHVEHYLRRMSGRMFEPHLVDTLLSRLDKFAQHASGNCGGGDA